MSATTVVVLALGYVLVGAAFAYGAVYLHAGSGETGNIAFFTLLIWPLVIPMLGLMRMIDSAETRGLRRIARQRVRAEEAKQRESEIEAIIRENAL